MNKQQKINQKLNDACTRVDGCEKAVLYVIEQSPESYRVVKKADDYLFKVEFKKGKIDVSEKEVKKNKLSHNLPNAADEAID